MIFNFIHEGRSEDLPVDVEYWSRLVAVYRYKCYQRPDGTVDLVRDYSRGAAYSAKSGDLV